MKRIKRIVEPFYWFFGEDSDFNLFGKIVLFPLILFICIIISVIDFLFTKIDD